MQNVRFLRCFVVAISLPFFAPSLVGLVGCGGASPGAVVTSGGSSAKGSSTTEAKIKAALAGDPRTPKETARDGYRHPLETLTFFGLKDDMTVIELSPGGGWFTAVLAPVLRERGKLVVVGGDPNGDPKSEGTQNAKSLQDRFSKAPQAFDKVETRIVHPKEEVSFGPPESADMVLTFRNFHNWVESGTHEAMLAATLKVLKHGGVLGVTDHRANPGAPVDKKTIEDTGYLPEDFVIKTIEAAGFKLAAKSEINANPKDTKNWPKGVWTLPPTLELGETDKAKYLAIGESDRMTLKFVKP
jgi:predicted methyltransferase